MDESQNETFNSRFSIPGFRAPTLATITGNMGEPLDYSEENEDSELSGTAHSEFPMTTIGSVAPHTQEITEVCPGAAQCLYSLTCVPLVAI
ncbi:hypothetical protein PHLCEN_2v6242 [Hermanssonia centrifuga]|uniref:Uncharacterized protein n=1 Tax=Hermanssonia centrifuga TaxID=98765 RepID=A0A2R6P0P1_9APHY|nr:hypothetical protein PHLCEN_2v6242 [Hermanssonia centrifuga]